MLKTIIKAMRIEQWYKNLVIFVGLIFSLNITNIHMFSYTTAAFVVFCILSSGVYLVNDIKDAESDRLHPKKRNRPIASGKLPINIAWILASFFIITSLAIAFTLETLFGIVCLLYLAQNLLYSQWLKSISIIDVAIVSTGFVWRAIAGTVVISVRTSPWLIICSFLLALFLALLKRKSELTTLTKAGDHRTSLQSYTPQLISNLLTITITSLLVAYMIYTFESEHIYMMATIPFAFIGIFRYIQLSDSRETNDDPTFIFRDRITQVNMLLWILTAMVALYELPAKLLALIP